MLPVSAGVLGLALLSLMTSTSGASLGPVSTVGTTTRNASMKSTLFGLGAVRPSVRYFGAMGFCHLNGLTCIRPGQCCSNKCVDVDEFNPMMGMICVR